MGSLYLLVPSLLLLLWNCAKDSDVRTRYGLHPSLVKPPRPTSRHDLIPWDFLNARTISSVRHKNPKRSLENSLKLGLMDVVRKVCWTTSDGRFWFVFCIPAQFDETYKITLIVEMYSMVWRANNWKGHRTPSQTVIDFSLCKVSQNLWESIHNFVEKSCYEIERQEKHKPNLQGFLQVIRVEADPYWKIFFF